MSQAERDDAEWHDPANWHGGLLGIYYSKADSRTFVPKPNPAFGFTVNFARPGGVAFFVGILLFAAAMVVLPLRGAR
jgi:uncharacterized membrane protein